MLIRYFTIHQFLLDYQGIEEVQAMHILCNYDVYEDEVKENCWSPEAISQMYKLKFLKIDGIFHDPQHLPNSLRVLYWRDYPSNSLPSTFQLDELVMLCLPESRIEQLWIGIKVIVLLSILTTLHLNFNRSDTRKPIDLTSFKFFFFLLKTEI